MINGIGNYINNSSYANSYANNGFVAILPNQDVEKASAIQTSAELEAAKRTGAVECQTCANRKYQDGSNEMVSFKSPAHISPEASAAKVMSHEREHVANAYSNAAKKNGQVVNASVTLHTAICSECGKSYVSGGTTTTAIKYSNSTPYDTNKKAIDADALRGMNIDTSI